MNNNISYLIVIWKILFMYTWDFKSILLCLLYTVTHNDILEWI